MTRDLGLMWLARRGWVAGLFQVHEKEASRLAASPQQLEEKL